MMSRPFILPVILLLSSLWCSCEAHDYWKLTESLSVDSTQGITKASNTDDISQDLFVRYQLDYELTNESEDQPQDVVVSATSYVNGFERSTAHKVWHLEKQETVQGIFMTSQLHLGNSLEVSLLCCSASSCTNKEVLCLDYGDGEPPVSVDEIAELCYDSCENIDDCTKMCPSKENCDDLCETDDEDYQLCRENYCTEQELLLSCNYDCVNDKECLDNCEPAPECQDRCVSLRASCFKNCLATWNRCENQVFEPKVDTIPCEICQGEGACQVNMKPSTKTTLTSVDGTVYDCEIDCRYYPSVCVTGCESLYESKSDRISCLDLCLQQQLYWCNDFSVPVDYVDSLGQQPCCFDTFCQSTLSGVVKSFDVECFNDTDCSSGKRCSDEGICVSKGSSSCQGNPMHNPSPTGIFWIIGIFGLAWVRRSRHET